MSKEVCLLASKTFIRIRYLRSSEGLFFSNIWFILRFLGSVEYVRHIEVFVYYWCCDILFWQSVIAGTCNKTKVCIHCMFFKRWFHLFD